MVHNWKSWCRLCAAEDPTKMHTNITLKSELETTFLDAISKHLSIDIQINDWPQSICTQCHEYVTGLISFARKASRVQTMFAELMGSNVELLDLEQLRAKYELGDDVKLDIPDPNSTPCVGEFEFIDEKMVNVPQIKTEEVEEDGGDGEDDNDNESNASDGDWQPDRDDGSSNDEDDDGNTTKVTTKSENDDDDEESEDKKEAKRRGRPKKKAQQYNCSTCNMELPSYAKYSRHMLKLHEITVEPLAFVCQKCNKSFATEKLCQKHELTHESPHQKVTTCPICNQGFKKNKLTRHIREEHAGAKPFACEDCGKSYTTFGNLKEHRLAHSEERPFKCRYCGKGFKNNARLRTHEDTHNDTNYICTCCGLQLNTRRTLNMHMLVHSEEKQHKCDICGKAYKRAKNLKIHLIMHAGLKSYMCSFCDKTFTCNANCRIHMKKIHPVELASLEASGAKISNAKIPKMKELREAISKKVLCPDSRGSMELDSTSSMPAMGGDFKQLVGDNQASVATAAATGMLMTTTATATPTPMQNNEQPTTQHPSQYFFLNRMNFNQLNAS